MELDDTRSSLRRLVIGNDEARVTITRNQRAPELFFVSWAVKWGGESTASGEVIFSKEDVLAAFGMANFCRMSGRALVALYGGDVAAPGKYIRYHQYLNVPGPSTGHDGATSVSVLLTEGIKRTVKHFIHAA
jgi:hypothetical protein